MFVHTHVSTYFYVDAYKLTETKEAVLSNGGGRVNTKLLK